jgi:hypothetical protein
MLSGKTAFAAYRKSDGHIVTDSVRSSRAEVIEYIKENWNHSHYTTKYNGFVPQKILLMPINFKEV